MPTVFLSLGSNLGDRLLTIKKAIEVMSGLEGIAFIQSSSVYETEPWGLKEQPQFLNMAVQIETELIPLALLEKLQKIENDFGRKRIQKWGSRTLDIDLLFYGQMIIEEKNLTVPHPRLESRKFVLIPLLEIAPDFLHPKTGKTIKELAKMVTDECNIQKFCNF